MQQVRLEPKHHPWQGSTSSTGPILGLTLLIMGSFIANGGKESKAVNQMEQLSAPSKLSPVGGGATGATSPPSHGPLSESSGGPGSPLNHSTGAYNNSNPQGMLTMPWR